VLVHERKRERHRLRAERASTLRIQERGEFRFWATSTYLSLIYVSVHNVATSTYMHPCLLYSYDRDYNNLLLLILLSVLDLILLNADTYYSINKQSSSLTLQVQVLLAYDLATV
jgi:hypothetical protein